MSQTTEAKIKDALIQLHGGIKNSDGQAISRALMELDEMVAAHGPELDPRLHHFLAGRSYAKALVYLGYGEDPTSKPATPPGGCMGGRS
jgi:hypothetical protein